MRMCAPGMSGERVQVRDAVIADVEHGYVTQRRGESRGAERCDAVVRRVHAPELGAVRQAFDGIEGV